MKTTIDYDKFKRLAKDFMNKHGGSAYRAIELKLYANQETHDSTEKMNEFLEALYKFFCDVAEVASRQRIVLVEDGSVDMDNDKEQFEKLDLIPIVYRQGSNKPEILD